MRNSLIPFLGSDLRSIFEQMEQETDNLFRRFVSTEISREPFPFSTGGYPKLDVIEEKERWVIRASVPGLEKDALSIELKKEEDGHLLTISGKKTIKTEPECDYCIREIKSSQFGRSIFLPNITSENVEAELKNGILTLKVAKAPTIKPDVTKIDIK